MKNKNICKSLNNMMQNETETKREAVTLILDYFDVCKVKHDKFETAAKLWEFSLIKLNFVLESFKCSFHFLNFRDGLSIIIQLKYETGIEIPSIIIKKVT